MRVLFIWHAAVEPSYRKLFDELAQDVELMVICPPRWTEGNRTKTISPALAIKNYRFVPLKVFFVDHIKLFCYPNLKKLTTLIKKFNPHLFHIFEEPYTTASFQFTSIKELLIPTASIVLQTFENIFIQQRPPFSWFESYVLNKADAIITIPQEGELILRKKGVRGKVFNMPIGIDETLFHQRTIIEAEAKKNPKIPQELLVADAEIFRIGFIGRLVPEKGLESLLTALTILKRKGYSCLGVLVGEGSFKQKLQLLAAEKGISKRIIFTGALSQEMLPMMFSCLDVVVLPSLSTRDWKEQFGRVLPEAMACGVPVVGSSSGEIPNVVGDGGLIFPEGNAEALAEALERLILNPDLRQKLILAGKKRVAKHFTWKVISKQYIKLYQQLLK